jgi:hypothetical protein
MSKLIWGQIDEESFALFFPKQYDQIALSLVHEDSPILYGFE